VGSVGEGGGGSYAMSNRKRGAEGSKEKKERGERGTPLPRPSWEVKIDLLLGRAQNLCENTVLSLQNLESTDSRRGKKIREKRRQGEGLDRGSLPGGKNLII